MAGYEQRADVFADAHKKRKGNEKEVKEQFSLLSSLFFFFIIVIIILITFIFSFFLHYFYIFWNSYPLMSIYQIYYSFLMIIQNNLKEVKMFLNAKLNKIQSVFFINFYICI